MYSLLGMISFIVQNQDTQGWSIAVPSSPSVIALASPAFLHALAVSTAATFARLHADTFDLHETGMTSTLSWCHALAVIAILAMRHASASVSRFILNRESRFLCSESEIWIHEDEPVVAFTDLGRDARAVAAGRADGLASADLRVSIAIEARAEIRRSARAVAAFDTADRLASERDVSFVVIKHEITFLADAEIEPHADSVCFASRVTDRVAHVGLKTCRSTIAWIAAAYVGLHADTVLATRVANGFAEAPIVFGKLVTRVAGAFVWRGAMSIDAISLAEGFAYV